MQLGPGPAVDPIHVASLRAALLTGERLELIEPGESEDFGIDWLDPRALTTYGDREPTEPWRWAGAQRVVDGVTWGGCIEVMHELMTAGRFDDDRAELDGGILLLETSEELIPAREFGWILRALGERGLLARSSAVLVARPPTSEHQRLTDSKTVLVGATNSPTRPSSSSRRTTPTRWSWSGSRSGTPGRSGSCRTATG